jgi:hypothetical protein
MKKISNNSDWDGATEKLVKRLGCWQGKITSIAGTTILINSSLTSRLIYMYSFCRVSVGVNNKQDSLRSGFCGVDTT